MFLQGGFIKARKFWISLIELAPNFNSIKIIFGVQNLGALVLTQEELWFYLQTDYISMSSKIYLQSIIKK